MQKTLQPPTPTKRFVVHLIKAVFSLALLLAFLGVGAFLAPPASAQTTMPLTMRSGVDTIIFVHGADNFRLSDASSGWDCSSDAWSGAIDYLSRPHEVQGQSLTWGRQDFRTLQYYSGDRNCGIYSSTGPGQITYNPDNGLEDLHNSLYAQHCSNYYPDGTDASMDGTYHESIYHLSCLLNWYLYLNFGVHSGWNVEIVAHSMGGLIVRNGIYQVQKSQATWTMPSTLGNISDVVTFNTPHGGVWGAGLTCASLPCTQGGEMDPSSNFMNEMYHSAQNPQMGVYGTDWTMMGSDKDPLVSTSSANWMDGGHKSYFICNTSTNVGCYNHGASLYDESDAYDVHIAWCDGCPHNPSSWNDWTAAPHPLHHMFYALWLSSW